MFHLNVYDNYGKRIDHMAIADSLEYIDGRVWKGKKHYYKGVGVPYNGHYSLQTIDSDYEIKTHSGIFYLGNLVYKKQFKGKIGVFTEKYQPQFSDYIGACGVKELDIIHNSVEFERSSVEVYDVNNFIQNPNQYYLMLDYKCKRIPYSEQSKARHLYELLEYMIINDFNFIWDKNVITDISHRGLVTDVADIFKSKALKHKVGTIYSVMYSLSKYSMKAFKDFVDYADLKSGSGLDLTLNAIPLLRRFDVNVESLLKDNVWDTYVNMTENYLIEGKNCGDCSFVGLGDEIRKEYHERFQPHK